MPRGNVRVLRVIARMNVGGPAIQITGLMSRLDNEGFEQRLITGFCEKNEIDYLETMKISLPLKKISGFGRSISVLSDLKVLWALRREMKDYDPHIIHTHTAKAGFLGRIASISIRKRHIRVHTFHGHLLNGYFGKFQLRLVILGERALARFTDSLVAVGSQVRDELLDVKIGKSNKYTVIGPGLEIGRLPARASSLRTFNLPEDKFIVTWIGRAVPVKAPHRIIEIAKECRERELRVHFLVVGDGPLLSNLKCYARDLHLPITFLGWQSDIERVLSCSDLVMLTSENEGTPVALIQAQMAGIPVLTTDVGSASEVVVNNQSGFCMQYSSKDFVDKIALISNNSAMKTSFAALGKIHAEKNFSLHRLVDKHIELYTSEIAKFRS